MSESMSKLVSYETGDQTDERVTKINAYTAGDQIDMRVSKMITYVVLDPSTGSASRFMFAAD